MVDGRALPRSPAGLRARPFSRRETVIDPLAGAESPPARSQVSRAGILAEDRLLELLKAGAARARARRSAVVASSGRPGVRRPVGRSRRARASAARGSSPGTGAQRRGPPALGRVHPGRRAQGQRRCAARVRRGEAPRDGRSRLARTVPARGRQGRARQRASASRRIRAASSGEAFCAPNRAVQSGGGRVLPARP